MPHKSWINEHFSIELQFMMGFKSRDSIAVKMQRTYSDLWMYQMKFILMVIFFKEFVSVADTNLSHRQSKHSTRSRENEMVQKWYEA